MDTAREKALSHNQETLANHLQQYEGKYIHSYIIHIYSPFLFSFSLFPTDTFRANYGKWFGLGVEDYDKYKESLRRVVDEGEGVVLVTMDVGDVEEGCRLFLEREVDGWDELVRFFFFLFLSFHVCLCL